MRRIVVALTVAGAIGALAAPANAASPSASCLGQAISAGASSSHGSGFGKGVVDEVSSYRDQGLAFGQVEASQFARSEC
jgi:hypothetical protein